MLITYTSAQDGKTCAVQASRVKSVLPMSEKEQTLYQNHGGKSYLYLEGSRFSKPIMESPEELAAQSRAPGSREVVQALEKLTEELEAGLDEIRLVLLTHLGLSSPET